jgi:predicted glutamine amidotransferase
MCGIAGINLHPSSKINVRELAHNLLSAIETRGSDSSGYAFVKGEQVGVYKNAMPGSQLPLSELPRRAQSVILHTRYATQGSHRDNRNNHPVLSPEGTIALVHNGVISNDGEFRAESKYYDGEFQGLAAVDTAVIPALIEKYGLSKAVEKLEGYAAIAYLNLNSSDKDILHIARLDYSPVAFTWLTDGTFVFASTEPLLAGALEMSGLDYGHIFHLPEETYIRVRDGVILSLDDGYKMQEDWYTRSRYSRMTAGNHGATKSSGSTGTVGSEAIGSQYNAYGIGSTFGNVEFEDESENLTWEQDAAIRGNIAPKVSTNADGSTTFSWENDYRSKVTTNPDEIAMAYANESNEPAGVWVAGPDGALVKQTDMAEHAVMCFYLTDETGAIDTYDTLEEMENYLDWLKNMTLGNDAKFSVEPKLKWTNFIEDMGHITEAEGMVSWLEDLANVDTFESPAVRNLDYLREGLIMMMLAR